MYSFIAILFLDFVIGLGWNNVYRVDLAPDGRSAMSPPRGGRSSREPGFDRAARRQHAVPLRVGAAQHQSGDSSPARRSASSARAAAARR